jgi:hypothetical protein
LSRGVDGDAQQRHGPPDEIRPTDGASPQEEIAEEALTLKETGNPGPRGPDRQQTSRPEWPRNTKWGAVDRSHFSNYQPHCLPRSAFVPGLQRREIF